MSFNNLLWLTNFSNLQQPVFEPLIGGKQLIGDNFFVQLAEWKYIKIFTGCKNSYGIVETGITVAEARRRLDQMSSMSDKLVICPGAVDIVQVKMGISNQFVHGNQ